MSEARREFLRGLSEVSPSFLGVLPFAMILGISAVEIGASAGVSFLHSTIVFAGTAQIAMLQLVRDGTTLITIMLTTIAINIRMLMYSATLAPHMKDLPLGWRLILSFVLTDQVFAFGVIRFANEPDLPTNARQWYMLGHGLPLWLIWSIGSGLGATIGARIPDSWSLDFAVVLVLLALVVPNTKSVPAIATAGISSFIAVAAFDLPFNAGMFLAALIGMMAGSTIEQRLTGEKHAE